MYQIPEQVRVEIAESQTFKSERLRSLMKLDNQSLSDALDWQASKLLQAGYQRKSITAYQELAPFLLEQKAFQTYLIEKNDPDLRSLLPDLSTVEELLALAVQEYRLNPEQTTDLQKLASLGLNA